MYVLCCKHKGRDSPYVYPCIINPKIPWENGIGIVPTCNLVFIYLPRSSRGMLNWNITRDSIFNWERIYKVNSSCELWISFSIDVIFDSAKHYRKTGYFPNKKGRLPRIIISTYSRIKSKLLIFPFFFFGKIDQKHHKLYHVESNPLKRKTDQNTPKDAIA